LRTLFDCKIRNNNVFEDCNSFYDSNLMIRDRRSEEKFGQNEKFIEQELSKNSNLHKLCQIS